MADRTTNYAKAAVDGKMVVGKFVKAACQRHLDDIKSGFDRGLTWDSEEAERVIDFFPALFTITAGAKEGEPFHLLDWMLFTVGSIFGWKDSQGKRRFRVAWVETGKGQAKSPLMGAVGIYLTCFAGVQRAECYTFASELKQAKIPFHDGVALVRSRIPGANGETLESLSQERGGVIVRGVGANAWRVEQPETGSKFEARATGDSLSGVRPIGVFGDEAHEWTSLAAFSAWKDSIDKSPDDPLMMIGTNTPANDQVIGTELSAYYQSVVMGRVEDDTAFAYIARVDENDDPFEDEACWVKALPALGVTFPIENVRKKVKTAKNMASERLSTERLYFGKPVGSSGHWVDEEKWNSAQGEVDESALTDLDCFLALDLSQKNDLTALSAVWADEQDRLTAKTFYWTTGHDLKRRSAQDKVPYEAWAKSGYLTIIKKEVIDYTFVAQQVAELCSRHKVKSLAVDSAMINSFISACDDIGFPVWWFRGVDKPEGVGLKMVAHSQGTRMAFENRNLCMPHSINRLTDKILEGHIKIENNPVTTACSANAFLTSDGQGNQAFDKKRSRGRIDGMVSIAMGVGASKDEKRGSTSYMASGVITT